MSFDPSTIQMLSTAASGVGAVTGAIGSLRGGQANADASMYQAAVARNNQLVAERNAQYALEAGRSAESNQRQKTAQMIGAQRAAMAANGIDIGSGSALNLQSDTGAIGELDALTIRNNAARQAYNYEAQAADFSANSSLMRMKASNDKKAGNIGAFSSLVGGASSVSDKWLRWKTPTTTTSRADSSYNPDEWY